MFLLLHLLCQELREGGVLRVVRVSRSVRSVMGSHKVVKIYTLHQFGTKGYETAHGMSPTINNYKC
jgi:hypothetical protein